MEFISYEIVSIEIWLSQVICLKFSFDYVKSYIFWKCCLFNYLTCLGNLSKN